MCGLCRRVTCAHLKKCRRLLAVGKHDRRACMDEVHESLRNTPISVSNSTPASHNRLHAASWLQSKMAACMHGWHSCNCWPDHAAFRLLSPACSAMAGNLQRTASSLPMDAAAAAVRSFSSAEALKLAAATAPPTCTGLFLSIHQDDTARDSSDTQKRYEVRHAWRGGATPPFVYSETRGILFYR